MTGLTGRSLCLPLFFLWQFNSVLICGTIEAITKFVTEYVGYKYKIKRLVSKKYFIQSFPSAVAHRSIRDLHASQHHLKSFCKLIVVRPLRATLPSSSHAPRNNLNDLMAVLFSFTRNIMFIPCSICIT